MTVADFPIRLPGNSPYDSPNTPIVARRGHILAERLLSGRPSYIKAILIHSRGGLNQVACSNCAAAYNRTGQFRHYAGCVSIPGWWQGACSNCVHDDHGNQCTLKGANDKLPYEQWEDKYDRKDNDKDR